MTPSNIHKEEIVLEENYLIRDIDTKETYLSFRTRDAAIIYLTSMRFGLKYFYEIYDIRLKKVLFEYIKYETNKGEGNGRKRSK